MIETKRKVALERAEEKLSIASQTFDVVDKHVQSIGDSHITVSDYVI
jgi:hypothetical protein